MDGPIASAVMLPEPQETDEPQPSPPSPAGQKRRQSSVTEQESKRQRLSSIDANEDVERRGSTSGKTPTMTAPGRRERGRERRLFGAALGALSQNSATASQRKRAEIEKRQRVQREQEGQEDERMKLERKAQRRKEQKRFERDSMRTRHANLRHMAHFLQTDAEPRLYYKPWETTTEEDDRIRAQIAEAGHIIRREQEQHSAQANADEEERERKHARNTDAEGAAGADRPTGKELSADAPQQPLTSNGTTTTDSGRSPKDPGRSEDHAEAITTEAVNGDVAAERTQQDTSTSHVAATEDESSKEMMDDNGEEIVEAAEDTVIY